MIQTRQDGQSKIVRAKLTTTNATTLYTTPSTGIEAHFKHIVVCNILAADTIDIWVNDGSSDFYLAKSWAIGAAETVTFDSVQYPFDPGDVLKVQAGTADTFDVHAVITEAPTIRGGTMQAGA